MKHGRPLLDPRIREALRQKRAAASHARKVIRKVQAECTHDKVLHVDWRAGEWLGASPGMRLCVRCGLEEHSPYGMRDYWRNVSKKLCSMETDYSRKPILCTEFVKVVSSDELVRHRPD